MTIKPGIIVTLLLGIVAFGTVFFRLVEGWSWIDSYFFSVITLSTVGYGSLVPVTAAGKIFTTVFIFAGLGIFAIAIQIFGAYVVRKRQEQSDWMVARLGHGAKHTHHHHHHHGEAPDATAEARAEANAEANAEARAAALPPPANEDQDPEP